MEKIHENFSCFYVCFKHETSKKGSFHMVFMYIIFPLVSTCTFISHYIIL